MAAEIRYKCPYCPMEIPGPGEHRINRHIKESHPTIEIGSSSTDEADHECPVCFLEFESVKALNDHIDIHWDEEETTRTQLVQDIQLIPIGSNAENIYSRPSVVRQNSNIRPKAKIVENRNARSELASAVKADQMDRGGSSVDLWNNDDSNAGRRDTRDSIVENSDAYGSAAGDIAVERRHTQRMDVEAREAPGKGTEGEKRSLQCHICSESFMCQTKYIKHLLDHENEKLKKRDREKIIKKKKDKEGTGENSVKSISKKRKLDHTDTEGTIPGLTDPVIFEEEPMEFQAMLMKLCVQSGRENVYESTKAKRQGKSIPPWSRTQAIELLEKQFPQALQWSRSTLRERMARAEANARKCIMTKEEVFRTGAGSLETIADQNLRPAERKSAKRPSNENEKKMADMVQELDEIRADVKNISQHKGEKVKFKNFFKNDKKNEKAKKFLKSISSLKNDEKSSGSESDDDEFSEKMAQDKIKKGTLVGRSKDKASEADEMRRRSVQAIANGYSVKKDDDQELDNVSGIDKLINVVTVLATKELEGGNAASNEKLKAVEEKQEKLENQMEKNKVEMEQKMEENKKEVQDKLDHNQMESNTRFDELKEAVDKGSQKQDNVLDKLTQFINSQSKKDKDSKND